MAHRVQCVVSLMTASYRLVGSRCRINTAREDDSKGNAPKKLILSGGTLRGNPRIYTGGKDTTFNIEGNITKLYEISVIRVSEPRKYPCVYSGSKDGFSYVR